MVTCWDAARKFASSLALNEPLPASSMVEVNCSKATRISVGAVLGRLASMAFVGAVCSLKAAVAAALSLATKAACRSRWAGDCDHSLAASQNATA